MFDFSTLDLPVPYSCFSKLQQHSRFAGAGASLNTREWKGETALGIAQERKKERIIELLKAAGWYHSCEIQITSCLLFLLQISRCCYVFHPTKSRWYLSEILCPISRCENLIRSPIWDMTMGTTQIASMFKRRPGSFISHVWEPLAFDNPQVFLNIFRVKFKLDMNKPFPSYAAGLEKSDVVDKYCCDESIEHGSFLLLITTLEPSKQWQTWNKMLAAETYS